MYDISRVFNYFFHDITRGILSKFCMISSGFSPESLQQPSAFIGCVKDVRFSDGTNDISANIHSQGALEEGCMSACGTDNTCQNNGKCVNLYTDTQCDCFQTGYHGDTCDKQGSYCYLTRSFLGEKGKKYCFSM